MSIAVAVVRDDPPEIYIANDQETLTWVIALKLIARTPGNELSPTIRDRLRQALLNEEWGEAVGIWMSSRAPVDVYPSHEIYTRADVQLAPFELEFAPLFQD